MTAKDQMAKLLTQLMGQNRDGDQKDKEIHFSERSVCRPFLLGICINDQFINTREEMGECMKVHSLAMRDEFERASLKRDYGFEEEVLEYLQSFIKDNERKIELAKKRIESVEDSPELERLAQEIHELAVQIGEKVNKSEELGIEGSVDESLAVLKEVEEIKEKKKELEEQYHTTLPRHAQQQQKLRACEVCGAFLSMYDNDRRLADHFGGKLHMGFVSIREKMVVLEETIAKKKEKREKEREERKNRDEKKSRSDSRDCKDRERERGSDRGSDRRRSHRSRSRERGRSRSRERGRSRDRDRDRGRRERSRERRNGSRNNGSRRRSRSRSKERVRSRS